MNCNEFRDRLLDLAAGTEMSATASEHARACPGCATALNEFRQTTALLDEWPAPADTSPYFMTRLRARLREEEGRSAGWLAWFRRPAVALTMTLLMVASASMFQSSWRLKDSSAGRTAEARALMKPGTPVGDLQYLEKNHDLLADFELLDGLEHN